MSVILQLLGLPADFGALNTFAIVAPFCIGTVYFLARFFVRYVLRFRPDPFYDPRPMRVWYTIATLNMFFTPIFSESGRSIPVSIGIILLTFLLYICNHDFGTEF